MHFKTYKWRVRGNIKYLLVKDMALKIVIMIFAVYGTKDQWWPTIICSILSLAGGIYYLIRIPYVLNAFNYAKVAHYFMASYIFFIAMIASTGDKAGDAASVLIFFFIIPGLIGWLICYIRSRKVVFKEDYVETNSLSDKKDPLSSEAKAEIAHRLFLLKLSHIKLIGVKHIESRPFGQLVDGEFRVNGEPGLTNLLVFLGRLSGAKFGKKVLF